MNKAEKIEQRIKDVYRKHPNLDWAKIASIKIVKEYTDFAEKEATDYLKWFKTVGVEKAIEWDCVTHIYKADQRGATVELEYKKLYQKFKADER